MEMPNERASNSGNVTMMTPEESVAMFTALRELAPEHLFAKVAQFYLCCLQNDKESAMAAATDELLTASRMDGQSSWHMAQCFALIDEHDKAVDWVANAISHGFWNYPLLAERDVLLQSARPHESYQSLMTELKGKWTLFHA